MEQIEQIEQSLQVLQDIGRQVLEYQESVVERVDRLRREILELKMKQRKGKVTGA